MRIKKYLTTKNNQVKRNLLLNLLKKDFFYLSKRLERKEK
jgi:hypothetical protein